MNDLEKDVEKVVGKLDEWNSDKLGFAVLLGFVLSSMKLLDVEA